MQFTVGTKVKIKSLEDVGSEHISTWTGVPVWADSRQQEFYGSENEFFVRQVDCYKRTYDEKEIYYIRLDGNPHSWTELDLEVVELEDNYTTYQIGDTVMTSHYGKECPSIITAVYQKRGCNDRYEIDDGTIISDFEIIGLWDGTGSIPEKRYCSRCDSFYLLFEEDNICEEDRKLCPRCRERNFITPYHAYSPAINFHKTSKDEPNENLFFGVELEVDGGGEINSYATEVMDILNKETKFIYCSHDGSLDAGFEIITQPATLLYHKSLKESYKKAFKKLISRGYRSHDTNTAGIHVHFSRDYYSDNEEDNIAKLLYLVEKFWDEIVVFSRRDYRTLERYAKKINSDPDAFVERWNKSGNHDGHYYAVNISNPHTIELRMFRGTLNYNTYVAILEFVNSIVRVAKEKTISELQQIDFESILTPLCLEYYLSRKVSDKFSEISNNSNSEDVRIENSETGGTQSETSNSRSINDLLREMYTRRITENPFTYTDFFRPHWATEDDEDNDVGEW